MPTSSTDNLILNRRSRWSRFRANRLAVAGLIVFVSILLIVIVTLPWTVHWYNVQSLDHAVRATPTAHPAVPYQAFNNALQDSRLISWPGLSRFIWQATSWMGHDDLGRSLFHRILPATLLSLIIGGCAAFVAVVLGSTWGATAALLGGRVDAVMMRMVDVLYSLPYILTVILMKVALTRPLSSLFDGHAIPANLLILVLAIGSVSWLTLARVVRGQVLSLRKQPFVEAARANGASTLYLLRHHILPNVAGPIVVYATLVVPQAILQESFLSFLGIGVQQPIPSLGRLAADGVEAVNAFVGFWWLIAFPCSALVVTLIALNFMGDGIRDALDPKSSQAPMI